MEENADMAVAGAAAGIGIGIIIVYLALLVFGLITMWKLFTKAGQPGWASIVPIYNVIVMLQIAGKPGWWILLLLIPIVQIVIGIMVTISLAKNFGKEVGFAIGMILLPIIFYPILAFGSAKYEPVQA
jgi:hypothetical protein